MILPPILEAAIELHFPFCFIGGLSVQRWGEPRFTQDAAATVLTRFVEDERLVSELLARFRGRRADTAEFALRTRVLLLCASNGVNLDIALGALDFEARSIDRSSEWTIGPGGTIRTCSAEDLVVHKAFASRELDWSDVDHILMRQGRALNAPQILSELRPLAELKGDPSIVGRLEALMERRGVVDRVNKPPERL